MRLQAHIFSRSHAARENADGLNYLLNFHRVLKISFSPFWASNFLSQQKVTKKCKASLFGLRLPGHGASCFKAVLMRVPAYQN